MAFPAQFLDELRQRVGVAQVVGRHVRLTKKGHEHSGLCPFHKEKTPSFTVNDDKGFYHCFGCGAHGSAIDFVMNVEGLGFREAVERLAGEAGMAVPVETPEEHARYERRQGLLDVVEMAAAYFEHCLYAPEGRGALDYLRGRGLDDATIRHFRLGFAPDSRDGLKRALGSKNITEAQLIEAGLIIQPDDAARASYDRFRGRVMFPITDRRGRAVAFGGRILENGDQGAQAGAKTGAKYLNSPETPLFHKGAMLYGLGLALPAARKTGTLVVAEGYMDVIALAHAGITNAVAPLGTALTEDQLRLMWGIVREPVLCFDGDAAGVRAALRAAERALPLLKSGYGLRFATLPAGEDPDSLIKAHGVAAMTALIEDAQPLSEVLWRAEAEKTPPTSPESRAALQRVLEDYARKIEDSALRAHFLRGFKDKIWEKRDDFVQNRGKKGDFGKKPPNLNPEAERRAVATHRIDLNKNNLREAILIAVLLAHPDLLDEIGERVGTIGFLDPDLDKFRQAVLKTLSGDVGLDSEGLRRHLEQDGFTHVLNTLTGPKIYEHAFFARPKEALEKALAGWEETYALYMKENLSVEIAAAKKALAENMTAEAFDRVRALKAQEQALSHNSADWD